MAPTFSPKGAFPISHKKIRDLSQLEPLGASPDIEDSQSGSAGNALCLEALAIFAGKLSLCRLIPGSIVSSKF